SIRSQRRGPNDSVGPRLAERPPHAMRALPVLLAGAAALYRSDDTDFWFHLAAGRSIALHGLPARETWCLAAWGQPPWLSEWLFQVVLHALHAAGGDLAIALWRVFWTMAVVTLAILLLQPLRAAGW